MKFLTKFFFTPLFTILLLTGCFGASEEEVTQLPSEDNKSTKETESKQSDLEEKETHVDDNDTSSDHNGEQPISETNAKNDTEITAPENIAPENDDSPIQNSNNLSDNDNQVDLKQYSAQEIEYARVWLQLGVVKDVEELYVNQIPAGTPLNPNDETSGTYPEDVIQLTGIRLIDGSVTYSGNGDGTINVYNVPQRWDGQYPAGEAFYQDIIDNTEIVYIDPGNNEDIIKLIPKIKIH